MKEIKDSIPEEIAIKLCQQIREENEDKLISWTKLQCWGCMRFSDFENKGSCIYGDPETLRGCNLVNKRYDKEFSK